LGVVRSTSPAAGFAGLGAPRIIILGQPKGEIRVLVEYTAMSFVSLLGVLTLTVDQHLT
jgi:hypothetical protein